MGEVGLGRVNGGKDTEGREGATWKDIGGTLLLKIAVAGLSLSQD